MSNGMMPETNPERTDYIDMLIDACRKPVKRVEEKTGREYVELELDTKKLNYKTQLVNYPGFGNFVKELENLENLIFDVFNYTSPIRAEQWAKIILRRVQMYHYSIDAKSSETLRDRNNSQSALTHILTRNKAERAITIQEEAKHSLMDAIRGKEKKEASGYD